MKRSSFLFFPLVVGVGLVLALSVPFSLKAEHARSASVFESIQQQIDAITAAIVKIQQRIAELTAEQTVRPPATGKPVATEEQQDTARAPLVVEEPLPMAAVYPLWEFMPLPSTQLTVNLVILYRFSITAGDEDAVVPSVTYTIAYADVSIKDLEVHAFSDELFSQKAYTNATKKDIVGKRTGFITSGNQTVTISLESGTPSVVVPAGETYYFELRGVPVAKNVSAFATVSAEGLQEVTLE